jgi:hypothetical protein
MDCISRSLALESNLHHALQGFYWTCNPAAKTMLRALAPGQAIVAFHFCFHRHDGPSMAMNMGRSQDTRSLVAAIMQLTHVTSDMSQLHYRCQSEVLRFPENI